MFGGLRISGAGAGAGAGGGGGAETFTLAPPPIFTCLSAIGCFGIMDGGGAGGMPELMKLISPARGFVA